MLGAVGLPIENLRPKLQFMGKNLIIEKNLEILEKMKKDEDGEE